MLFVISHTLYTSYVVCTIQTEQGKHWEEVKQLKDSESLLLEECDRLNQVRINLISIFTCSLQ